MSLSARAKRLIQHALGNKGYGTELAVAIDASTAANVERVTPSVIDNIVIFDGITGSCADSAIPITNIAAALAYHQNAVSHNLAGVAPTSAECIAAFGSIVSQTGQVHIMLDSSDATKTYVCASDGVAWWQKALTKTV